MSNPFEYFIAEVQKHYKVTFGKFYMTRPGRDMIIKKCTAFVLWSIDGLNLEDIMAFTRISERHLNRSLRSIAKHIYKNDYEIIQYYSKILEIHNESLLTFLKLNQPTNGK